VQRGPLRFQLHDQDGNAVKCSLIHQAVRQLPEVFDSAVDFVALGAHASLFFSPLRHSEFLGATGYFVISLCHGAQRLFGLPVFAIVGFGAELLGPHPPIFGWVGVLNPHWDPPSLR
jgi:hypothetical protein